MFVLKGHKQEKKFDRVTTKAMLSLANCLPDIETGKNRYTS